MNILISGSTGLIGSELIRHLESLSHDVYPLHRGDTGFHQTNHWDPENHSIQLDHETSFDAVIHLAGENIASSRWTDSKKEKIINSRVDGTELIADAISRLKIKPECFISASAIGYYGDTGPYQVDESSHRGDGFLSEVATRWEAATQAAEDAGIRTIKLRTGIVLSRRGGVLKKMLPPFSLGLGGTVGDGNQYMSWISIDDVINIITMMLTDKEMSGHYNLVAPNPVTNEEFTGSLGNALKRPTSFPMPAFMARLLFGEMADALLLSSSRVVSRRLEEYGYKFLHSDLPSALSHNLGTK